MHPVRCDTCITLKYPPKYIHRQVKAHGQRRRNVRHLSKDFGINEDTIIREGIIEFIRSKIKACMRDRFEIMSQYSVSSQEELLKKCQHEAKSAGAPGDTYRERIGFKYYYCHNNYCHDNKV